MRPGVVASIRVNPKDCMSIIDTIKNTGLYVPGMSYPAMVSMVLSACLESLRKHGTIPTRDGFEYLQMMEPYLGQGRNKKARNITNALISNSDFQVRPVAGTANPYSVDIQQPATQIHTPKFNAMLAEECGMTVREAQVELTELCAKKDLADDGQYTWTQHNQERFDLCYKIVYPEG